MNEKNNHGSGHDRWVDPLFYLPNSVFGPVLTLLWERGSGRSSVTGFCPFYLVFEKVLFYLFVSKK